MCLCECVGDVEKGREEDNKNDTISPSIGLLST